jgi:hypothetical protein
VQLSLEVHLVVHSFKIGLHTLSELHSELEVHIHLFELQVGLMEGQFELAKHSTQLKSAVGLQNGTELAQSLLAKHSFFVQYPLLQNSPAAQVAEVTHS